MVTMGGFKFAIASQSYTEYIYIYIHVCMYACRGLFIFYDSSDLENQSVLCAFLQNAD